MKEKGGRGKGGAGELPDTARGHVPKKTPSLGFAVGVVSSTRFREARRGEPTSDLTIPVARQEVEDHPPFRVALESFLPDDQAAVRRFVRGCVEDPSVDVVVLSGGTGLSAKDRTVEACRPLFELELPGFGETFRWLSFQQVGAAAILSRATAGIVGGKPVYCVPGSPKAVKLALRELILPAAAHVWKELRKE
ncbi:MAG: molybdenum cofactor biosynthesis protein MoaB [Promethearchaeota archaeon]